MREGQENVEKEISQKKWKTVLQRWRKEGSNKGRFKRTYQVLSKINLHCLSLDMSLWNYRILMLKRGSKKLPENKNRLPPKEGHLIDQWLVTVDSRSQ